MPGRSPVFLSTAKKLSAPAQTIMNAFRTKFLAINLLSFCQRGILEPVPVHYTARCSTWITRDRILISGSLPFAQTIVDIWSPDTYEIYPSFSKDSRRDGSQCRYHPFLQLCSQKRGGTYACFQPGHPKSLSCRRNLSGWDKDGKNA